ncbi:hypothetical protein SDC9_123885 [bioreactor metagenome]|uniref:Uncharacterized protein n=1 Tax=bioreactor metagenome TaxID=1076179 RepID=A0A645CIV6_9ZZZZ
MGVVDQPLPAYRGARLLEVHPHHHQQVVLQSIGLGLELVRILDGSHRVVNGTGPDHHQQAVVRTIQDAVDCLPGLKSDFCGLRRGGKLAQHVGGRHQLLDFRDADVVDMNLH